MYCEKCQILFEGSCCPVCGNRNVREADGNDPCFLIEKDPLWGGLVADVLKQNQIPFLVQNELGAGLTANIGSFLERSRFYVPHRYLQRAAALMSEFFPADYEV